jgi:2-haloacid dehalogenase
LKPEWVTFDCYGTLVDWETGIRTVLNQIISEKKAKVRIDDLLKAREDAEFELIQSPYKSYREFLHLSLQEACRRFHVPYSPRDGVRLAESIPTWPVFKETKPALEQLARKCRLGIISNIDTDIIEATKAKVGVKFALTVTAQEAGAYKPSTKPFEMTLQKLGCPPDRVLHVSSGFKYDIQPAHRIGFRTAWVNRKKEAKPSGLQADHEFRSLTELAEYITETS